MPVLPYYHHIYELIVESLGRDVYSSIFLVGEGFDKEAECIVRGNSMKFVATGLWVSE